MCCLGFTSSKLWLSLDIAGGDLAFLVDGEATGSEARDRDRHLKRIFFEIQDDVGDILNDVGKVANSCIAPSILIEVMAAPSSEESSTRRSELPTVWP